jgi:hypothetical protein
MAAIVACVLLSVGMAAGEGLGEMGARTNLQVALWETDIPGEKAALQELMFSFQRANPDVIVCLEWQDAILQDEWTRRWSGGQREYAPDVTVMTERRAWENRHELLEMPPEFGRELRRECERSVMRRLPGRARGVPWSVKTYALYYRPDLFAEAELEVPTTLDALVDAAEAVADPPNHFGLGFPRPDAGAEELLHVLAEALGDEAAPDTHGEEPAPDDDGPRATSERDRPDYAPAMEVLVDLQSRGALQPETLTWSDTELVELFAEGRLAMVIAPISAARTLRGLEEPPEWANAPLPIAEGGTGYLSVQWLVAFKDTDRPANAIRLLKYIAEPASQRMLAMLPGVPASRSIARELSESVPWAPHIRPLDGAEGLPLARWDRLRPELGRALIYALSGRMTPRSALAETIDGEL